VRAKGPPQGPSQEAGPCSGRGAGVAGRGVLPLTTCPGRSWPSLCLQTPCKAAAGCGYSSSVRGTGREQAGHLGLAGRWLLPGGGTPNHPAQPGDVVREPRGKDFCHAFSFHLPGPAAWVRPEAWQAPAGITPAEPQLLVGVNPPHAPPRALGTNEQSQGAADYRINVSSHTGLRVWLMT